LAKVVIWAWALVYFDMNGFGTWHWKNLPYLLTYHPDPLFYLDQKLQKTQDP